LTHAALGNRPTAIADYDQVIRLNPKDAQAYYSRGNAYVALQDYPQAIENYDQSIRLNAQYAPAYYNRGNVHAALGNKAAAKADL
jgi:tetratricopeptide (TPR) repeat protein